MTELWWAPGLADVARHVPTRTRDSATPGSDRLLGTFTATTTPTAEQAQAVIDAAVATISGVYGAIPTSLGDLARDAAEWRAAADIEYAYPDRSADVQVARDLDARAQLSDKALAAAIAGAGAGLADLVPEWQFPAPPPWADKLPGSGADYEMSY